MVEAGALAFLDDHSFVVLTLTFVSVDQFPAVVATTDAAQVVETGTTMEDAEVPLLNLTFI
jgi:hypothetical protein